MKDAEVKVAILDGLGVYRVSVPGRAAVDVKPSSGRLNQKDAIRAAKWVLKGLKKQASLTRKRPAPMTRTKARTMLHEGRARGHALTRQQQKYFGAVAGGYAKTNPWGWVTRYSDSFRSMAEARQAHQAIRHQHGYLGGQAFDHHGTPMLQAFFDDMGPDERVYPHGMRRVMMSPTIARRLGVTRKRARRIVAKSPVEQMGSFRRAGDVRANPGAVKWTVGNTNLQVWEERDRLHVGLETKSGKTIADWWDDDARQMFSDGFFSARNLHQSVVDYANQMGIGAKRRNPEDRYVRRSAAAGDYKGHGNSAALFKTLRANALRAKGDEVGHAVDQIRYLAACRTITQADADSLLQEMGGFKRNPKRNPKGQFPGLEGAWYTGGPIPTLTRAQVSEVSRILRGIGKKLPRHGWCIRLPDGREVCRDHRGYYFVGQAKGNPQDDEIRALMRAASVSDPASIRRLAKVSLRSNSEEGFTHAFELAAKIPDGKLMRALQRIAVRPSNREFKKIRAQDELRKSFPRARDLATRRHTGRPPTSAPWRKGERYVRRYSGDVVVDLVVNDHGRYSGVVRWPGGSWRFSEIGNSPSWERTHAIDSAESYDEAARGALSFGFNEHEEIIQHAEELEPGTGDFGIRRTYAAHSRRSRLRNPRGQRKAVIVNIECPTPHEYRQFRQIATSSPSKAYGEPRAEGGWILPSGSMERFNELLDACRGRTEPWRPEWDKKENPRPSTTRSKSDREVILAFTEGRAAEGRKLTSTGKRLDGNWMGGRGIAEWTGQPGLSKISLGDLGSRAAQSVQRALKRCFAPHSTIFYPAWQDRRGNPNSFPPAGPQLPLSSPEASDLADELLLYAENTYELNGQKESIEKNLLRKIGGRRYDYRQAPKLWGYWVESAAKRYCKEMPDSDACNGRPWHVAFPVNVRAIVANRLARDFEYVVREGGGFSYPEQARATEALRGGRKNPSRPKCFLCRKADADYEVALSETSKVRRHYCARCLSYGKYPRNLVRKLNPRAEVLVGGKMQVIEADPGTGVYVSRSRGETKLAAQGFTRGRGMKEQKARSFLVHGQPLQRGNPRDVKAWDIVMVRFDDGKDEEYLAIRPGEESEAKRLVDFKPGRHYIVSGSLPDRGQVIYSGRKSNPRGGSGYTKVKKVALRGAAKVRAS